MQMQVGVAAASVIIPRYNMALWWKSAGIFSLSIRRKER